MTDTTITSVVNTPSDQIVTKSGNNIFLGSNTFTGGVNIFGGFNGLTRIITDTGSITLNDYSIICNKSTDFTLTLPVGISGQFFNIKNINTGIVTIDASGAETIDGELNQQINQWDNMSVQCYEVNKWGII